jgi:hypothetical protein
VSSTPDSTTRRIWDFAWKAAVGGVIGGIFEKATVGLKPDTIKGFGQVISSFLASNVAPLWFIGFGVIGGLIWAAWPQFASSFRHKQSAPASGKVPATESDLQYVLQITQDELKKAQDKLAGEELEAAAAHRREQAANQQCDAAQQQLLAAQKQRDNAEHKLADAETKIRALESDKDPGPIMYEQTLELDPNDVRRKVFGHTTQKITRLNPKFLNVDDFEKAKLQRDEAQKQLGTYQKERDEAKAQAADAMQQRDDCSAALKVAWKERDGALAEADSFRTTASLLTEIESWLGFRIKSRPEPEPEPQTVHGYMSKTRHTKRHDEETLKEYGEKYAARVRDEFARALAQIGQAITGSAATTQTAQTVSATGLVLVNRARDVDTESLITESPITPLDIQRIVDYIRYLKTGSRERT